MYRVGEREGRGIEGVTIVEGMRRFEVRFGSLSILRRAMDLIP